MMISVLMALAATAASPTAVDLSIEDRRALVYGLRSRIGGDFVLSGLANVEGICNSAAACVTVASLVEDGTVARGGAVRTVDDLATHVRVNGAAPAAVVALRGAERLSRNQIQVFASVYDPATKHWSGRTMILQREGSNIFPKAAFYTSRVVSWKSEPAFDL